MFTPISVALRAKIRLEIATLALHSTAYAQLLGADGMQYDKSLRTNSLV